jgi:hypothetical protein
MSLKMAYLLGRMVEIDEVHNRRLRDVVQLPGWSGLAGLD